MAKPDWASRKVDRAMDARDLQSVDQVEDWPTLTARLLRAERRNRDRRAVRVAEKVRDNKNLPWHMSLHDREIYQDACADILAKLKEGT